jgi:para-aminobenzoate synthetase component 1
LCKKLSGAIFLDSNPKADGAHFDILSAEPIQLVQKDACMVSIDESYKIKELKALMQTLSSIKEQALPPSQDLYSIPPFTNGLIGFFSYTLGEKLKLKAEKVNPNKRLAEDKLPCFFVGHYTWSYVFDHQTKLGYLTFSPLCDPKIRQKILTIINSPTTKTAKEAQDSDLSLLDWKKSQSFETYQKQFLKIQQYIMNGDCYQVNLTQMFEAKTNLNAVDLYFSSREKTQTPYSCYIAFNKNQNLLSFSPEQFISIKDRIIESKPIKGTIANNGNNDNLEILKNSKKNQAENVMIVDLIRNDLGQVCQPNSIHVPELFKIESYKNVHHLVSHIKGTLKQSISELEAFLACFPGGSITGAPKIRSMEIINELEIQNRSAYCGSVFYLNQNGNFDSNILIRTVVKDGEQLFCWAGGGIVADSDALDEYQESLTKVENITGIKN